jgi:acetyl-CoA synthetase
MTNMSDTGSGSIESVLQENRVFPPPSSAEAGMQWHVSNLEEYRAMHRRSLEDPEAFWGGIAGELHWFRRWDRVCGGGFPDTTWFVGGRTNLCYNAVDRQVASGHGDEVAIIFEGEPMPGGDPEIQRITYRDLQDRVSRMANVLRSHGIGKGDVVTIYMGMVPDLAVAMLACARIGAPHSIIFGGFSSQAIVDRVTDASSRIIITCDGAWRRGSVVPLKANVDAACAELEGTEHAIRSVLVSRRCGNEITMREGRDVELAVACDAASPDCPCAELDSEDMAFLLYTSGSTGKPKGIQHTTGGYMVHAYMTSRYTFNLIPDQGQVYWCTADIGWVTGHTYIIYGILPHRVPTLMYEGAPNFPAENRFWDMVERHRVTQFYTAPTAIRAFMKWGDRHVEGHDLSSLKLLGTVGEPINPEAWMWYHEKIGGGRCPIVDTWWQTETGGHMLTPLPGATPTKPGSCCLPMFGVDAGIVNDEGVEQPLNTGGLLAIRRPWPGMLRGVYGDRDRFIDTYFSRLEGMYFPGDGARRDADGYFWIMGRVDDVINVSGHRLGTMEVESALVSHEAVVEAAVVGMPHEIKGTGIAAFVTLEPSHTPEGPEATEALRRALVAHVASEIGAIAKPDMIRFTDALPKTRSGKIMRRLLRSIAAGDEQVSGDMTTLEDFSVLARLQESSES